MHATVFESTNRLNRISYSIAQLQSVNKKLRTLTRYAENKAKNIL